LSSRFDCSLNALGWLLWSFLALGPLVWGYEKFFNWTPTCHCHRRQRTFSANASPVAYRNYAMRVIAFAPRVKAMVGRNADLIKNFKSGRYKQHKEDFDADTSAFCNSLLESIEQFEGQQVPDVLEKSHIKISNCHRLCYESIQALREAYSSEGAEQQRLLKEAEKKMKEAWTTGDAGFKLHKAVWADRSKRPPAQSGPSTSRRTSSKCAPPVAQTSTSRRTSS